MATSGAVSGRRPGRFGRYGTARRGLPRLAAQAATRKLARRPPWLAPTIPPHAHGRPSTSEHGAEHEAPRSATSAPTYAGGSSSSRAGRHPAARYPGQRRPSPRRADTAERGPRLSGSAQSASEVRVRPRVRCVARFALVAGALRDEDLARWILDDAFRGDRVFASHERPDRTYGARRRGQGRHPFYEVAAHSLLARALERNTTGSRSAWSVQSRKPGARPAAALEPTWLTATRTHRHSRQSTESLDP